MGIIRLILALSIVIHHSNAVFGLNLLGRDPALRSFYIISGFYMALILNEKYIGKNGSYRLFITNRLLRIYPLYWAILILTLFLTFLFFHTGVKNTFTPAQYQNMKAQLPMASLSFWDLVRNLTLIIRGDYLQFNTGLREIMVLPQSLTLVLEVLFYIVAPFIVRRKTITIFFFALLSLLVRFASFAYLRLNGQQLGDWFFPGMIIFFLMGALSYKLYVKMRRKKMPKNLLYFLFILSLTFCIFYSNLHFFPDYQIMWMDIKQWIFLISLTLTIPFIFLLTSKDTINNVVGDLSYPIYLCHLLILLILTALGFDIKGPYFGLFFVLITIIASFVLTKSLEIPIERYRQKRLPQKINIRPLRG